MKLSPNFSLEEMLKSPTASRMGIDNTTRDPVIIANLSDLVVNVLQPLRDAIGKPITIMSGYRCPQANKVCGGAAKSQHMSGQAADIECYGMSTEALGLKIHELGLPVDQTICEYYKEGDVNSGWIHCSYVNPKYGKNRGQFLKYDGTAYTVWKI